MKQCQYIVSNYSLDFCPKSFSFFLYRYPPAPTLSCFAALSLEELISLFLCGGGIPSSVYVWYASTVFH